jgi:predicted membrane protein
MERRQAGWVLFFHREKVLSISVVLKFSLLLLCFFLLLASFILFGDLVIAFFFFVLFHVIWSMGPARRCREIDAV